MTPDTRKRSTGPIVLAPPAVSRLTSLSKTLSQRKKSIDFWRQKMNLNKKFQQDIKTLTEHRKNLLDKLSDKVYNIRTGLKETSKIMKVSPTHYTRDAHQTDLNLERLKEVYDTISEVSKSEYGFTPVIAGGSVRDTLLGVPYADIDVFFVNDPKEDLSDFLVYVSELFRKKDAIDIEVPATPIGAKRYYWGEGTKDAFTGYELYSRRLKVVQFMAYGRDTTPEELIEGFDYDLVKCWYDGDFHVSEEFDRAVGKGRSSPQTLSAWSRAKAFRDRTGYKIVVGKPPKDALAATPTDFSNPKLKDYQNKTSSLPRPQLWFV